MIFPYTATSAYQRSFSHEMLNVLPLYVLEINNNDLFHAELTDVLFI